MSEYTPTTEQVRRDYAYVLFEFGPTPRKLAEFDRWLAQVKAEAQVEALRGAADDWHAENAGTAPRMHSWLHDRADRIARGAGIETKEATDG